jgi:hypothetical protein
MSARKTILCLPAVFALLGPAVAFADAWLPQPGEHYVEFRAAHGSASQFFDNDGNRQPYLVSAIMEDRQLVSYNEIGWKKNVSLVLAMPGRSITLRSDPLGLTRTATGFSDLLLGLRLKLLGGPTALSLQADWKAPLGYEHTLAPILGDGQQDIAGRLSFGTGIAARGFLELQGGYRYRFEDPLDQIEYAADLGFWVGSSLLIEGRYDGLSSVGEDTTFVSQGIGAFHRRARLHAAGPRVTYRLDDRLDLFAGSRYILSAKNAHDLKEYYAGIALKKSRLNRLQGFLGGKQGP